MPLAVRISSYGCTWEVWRALKKLELLSAAPRATLKAGTHEGACSRSTLLQHAPGAKLPRLHQRFLAKKYVAQQNFCSRVLLPHIKLVWYEGASSRVKSVTRFCFMSKLPLVYWNLLCGSVSQEQAPSCVLKFALRERVSGASSLVWTGWRTYPGSCFGSVFQEKAPSCVLVGVLTRKRVSGACFRSKLSRVYRPYTLLSCSPNFSRASITRYTHAKHEPILKYYSYCLSCKKGLLTLDNLIALASIGNNTCY